MTEETLNITNTNIKELVDKIERHSQYLEQHALTIETIKDKIENQVKTPVHKTYAEAAATSITHQRNITPPRPHHSLIIASHDTLDTSDKILDKLRTTLDARHSGIQIQSVRKIREQRVILSCSTQEEAEIIAEKLTHNKQFKLEKAKNKDPLIILKNLFTHNTDKDIIESITEQNHDLIEDIPEEQLKTITVKYKRKTRNPNQNHVVLQVSPEIWQRLTNAGYIYIDLQRIRVEDQTPSYNALAA